MLVRDAAFFAVCATLILLSARRLVRHADALAHATKLGHTRIGLTLVALATSLPELIAGFTAAGVLQLPNIAVGNILGTLPLNLLMLAIADFAGGHRLLFTRRDAGHLRALALAFAMAALAALAIALGPRSPSLWGVGMLSPLLVLGFAWALFRKEEVPSVPDETTRVVSLRDAVTGFVLHALVIALAASLLPNLAARIADASGLGRTFMGTTFLALATTLPELSVAVSAVRLRVMDLVIGNALGSILLNLALLGVEDFVYPGVLLADAAGNHLATLAGALPMFLFVGIALRWPPKKKVIGTWVSWALAITYVLVLVALYATS